MGSHLYHWIFRCPTFEVNIIPRVTARVYRSYSENDNFTVIFHITARFSDNKLSFKYT